MLLMSSSTESFLELLGVLLIFLFVLVITWLATRYMANFQKSKNAGNNMQVIETISIGNGKYLSLVALGEIYLVVSVGKDEVYLQDYQGRASKLCDRGCLWTHRKLSTITSKDKREAWKQFG